MIWEAAILLCDQYLFTSLFIQHIWTIVHVGVIIAIQVRLCLAQVQKNIDSLTKQRTWAASILDFLLLHWFGFNRASMFCLFKFWVLSSILMPCCQSPYTKVWGYMENKFQIWTMFLVDYICSDGSFFLGKPQGEPKWYSSMFVDGIPIKALVVD